MQGSEELFLSLEEAQHEAAEWKNAYETLVSENIRVLEEERINMQAKLKNEFVSPFLRAI